MQEEANTIKTDQGIEMELFSKHPLQNTWTLWYYLFNRKKSWEQMLNEVSSVYTAEDFWSLFNHIKPATELSAGCDYSLFKKNIRPMWEDPVNKYGGRWFIALPRNQHSESFINRLWINVMLLTIGETFIHENQVNGAVINVRSKYYKISIWTADGSNEEAIMEIGNKMLDQVQFENSILHYELHIDAMVRTGVYAKSLYAMNSTSNNKE